MKTATKSWLKRPNLAIVLGVVVGVYVSNAHAALAGPPDETTPPAVNTSGPVAPVAQNAKNIASSVSAVPGSMGQVPSQGPVPTGMVPSQADSSMGIAVPAISQDASGSSSADGGEKTVEATKKLIKRMDVNSDKITVEDLNAARQAIARIDMLIELEKKLSDLEKVRGAASKAQNAAAVPPPMLNAMPLPVIQPLPVISEPPPASLDILRIVGSAGAYSAVVASGEGENKTIRVGDVLSGGEKVVDIDPTGVIIDRKGDRRQVHIKNVARVFGSTP